MEYKQLTDKELYNYCQEVGAKARQWKNEFLATLPEVYKRKLYRKKGYGSIYEFAAKLGGVSKNVVSDVLNLNEKLHDKPQLKKLIPKIGINKVRVVAHIATKEDQNQWAAKAQKMSKKALETHVRELRNSDPGIGKPKIPQKIIYSKKFDTFTVKLDPKVIQQLKILKANMKTGSCWNDLFKELLENKKIKKQRARNLKKEAKDICEAKKCNNPAEIIHHVDRFSLTKNHKNLKSLCKAHHELAHLGYEEDYNPQKAYVDNKMLKHLTQKALFT